MRDDLLGAGDVHVWCAPLEPMLDQAERWAQTLSEEERQRAARYRFEPDRQRFRARRGLLRALLGVYLGGASPAALRFQSGPQGKPALTPEWTTPRGRPLAFSVSDSHGLVLYALAAEGRVGVDVEFMRPVPEIEAMIGRFFSAEEAAEIAPLRSGRRVEAFFRGWTRKEALVKADGRGLWWPLDSVEVFCGDEPGRGTPPRLGGAPSQTPWGIRSLTPAEGYTAAVAAEGDDWHLSLWRWPQDGDMVPADGGTFPEGRTGTSTEDKERGSD